MEINENYKGEIEDLYKDAVVATISSGKCSTSLLQRKLRIGYFKACKVVDLLEERGIVGKFNGAKPREVLVDAMPLLAVSNE